MGKKLDALLGRKVKTSKFRTLTNLAICRIAILKKQRHVRCSHARSDVLQLLILGHQERALLRVEYVIKDQNMLDVFGMIENYCCLLIDRDMLIQNSRECPEELKESISSLIFASSRCAEFPELQQIRDIFTSRFGKTFAVRAVELRNNCGVNPKMIQKLSMRQASFESRLKVLKQIASNNGITLHLEDDPHVILENKKAVDREKKQAEQTEATILDFPELGDDVPHLPEEPTSDEELSESVKARKKYRDVAAAAQDAFESAAYAAAAARAAVELSRSESWDDDSDDHYGSNHQRKTIFSSDGSPKFKNQIDGDAASEDVKHSEKGLGLDKIYPVESFSSESEGEEMKENSRRRHSKELEQSKKKAGLESTLSASSLSSDGNDSSIREIPLKLHDRNEPVAKEIIFDESDDETENYQDNIPWLKHQDFSSDKNSNLAINEFLRTRKYNAAADENHSDEKESGLHSQSPKWMPLKSQVDAMTYSVEGRSRLGNKHHLNAEKHFYSQHSDRDRKPTSRRTRRVERD